MNVQLIAIAFFTVFQLPVAITPAAFYLLSILVCFCGVMP